MEVTRRPAAGADEALLLQIYAGTRQDELAQFGWSEAQVSSFVAGQFAAQSAHYARHYPEMTAEIVLVDGEPAGRLLVDRRTDQLRIVDISLLPAVRGQSIGTELITELQQEAAAAGKPVTIHVHDQSPAARLYRRLGFRLVELREPYLFMRWPVPTGG